MAKIVFDIGGTNMRVAAVRDGRPLSANTQKTPRDPTEAIENLALIAGMLTPLEDIEAVAGGLAGVADANGRLCATSNLPEWHQFPFQAALEERLGVPVIVQNDSALAALGETLFGSGAGYDIVGYLGIGTGVGGARIIRGKIDERALSFEPGLQIIDACKRKTLEQYVSGAAIQNQNLTEPALVPRVRYDKLTEFLAIGVYNCITLWSPHAIILGGSLMNEENGYRLNDIIRTLAKVAMPGVPLPAIHRAMLGQYSALYGARTLI